MSEAEQDPRTNVNIPQSPLVSECLIIPLAAHLTRKPKDNPALSLEVSVDTAVLGELKAPVSVGKGTDWL